MLAEPLNFCREGLQLLLSAYSIRTSDLERRMKGGISGVERLVYSEAEGNGDQ
ncbi:hypothetical protein B14911_22977 [Bacillus sp. NRRL B-14911]|nr:hypothetical protein B14911_22977 [Bacillus sp. NRRL B-14911]